MMSLIYPPGKRKKDRKSFRRHFSCDSINRRHNCRILNHKRRKKLTQKPVGETCYDFYVLTLFKETSRKTGTENRAGLRKEFYAFLSVGFKIVLAYV